MAQQRRDESWSEPPEQGPERAGDLVRARVRYGLIPTQAIDHWPPTEEDLFQPKVRFGSVPAPDIDHWPPTEDDLPSDDGVPMESLEQHWLIELLIECGLRYWSGQAVTLFGDMILYYNPVPGQPLARPPRGQQWFVGPDLFVVKGLWPGEQLKRKSYLPWREGRLPSIVVEFLSESTARRDTGEKRLIYESLLQVPEYFIHDPETAALRGFRLRDGRYQPIPFDQGRLWSEELGLWFVIWEGEYRGVTAPWLRWTTPDGVLLPTDAEAAAANEQRAARSEQQTLELAELLARYRERFGDLDPSG